MSFLGSFWGNIKQGYKESRDDSPDEESGVGQFIGNITGGVTNLLVGKRSQADIDEEEDKKKAEEELNTIESAAYRLGTISEKINDGSYDPNSEQIDVSLKDIFDSIKEDPLEEWNPNELEDFQNKREKLQNYLGDIHTKKIAEKENASAFKAPSVLKNELIKERDVYKKNLEEIVQKSKNYYTEVYKEESLKNIQTITNELLTARNGELTAEDREVIEKYKASEAEIASMISEIPEEEIKMLSETGAQTTQVVGYLRNIYGERADNAFSVADDIGKQVTKAKLSPSGFDEIGVVGGALMPFEKGFGLVSSGLKKGISALGSGAASVSDSLYGKERFGSSYGDQVLLSQYGLNTISDSIQDYKNAWDTDQGFMERSFVAIRSTAKFLTANESEIITAFSSGGVKSGVKGAANVLSNPVKAAGQIKDAAEKAATTFRIFRNPSSAVKVPELSKKMGDARTIINENKFSENSKKILQKSERIYDWTLDGIGIDIALKQANHDNSPIDAEELAFIVGSNIAAQSIFKIPGVLRFFRKDSDDIDSVLDGISKSTTETDDYAKRVMEEAKNSLKKVEELNGEDSAKSVFVRTTKKIAEYKLNTTKNIMEGITRDNLKAEYMRKTLQGVSESSPFFGKDMNMREFLLYGGEKSRTALVSLFDETLDQTKKELKLLQEISDDNLISAVELSKKLAKSRQDYYITDEMGRVVGSTKEGSEVEKMSQELTGMPINTFTNIWNKYSREIINAKENHDKRFLDFVKTEASKRMKINTTVRNTLERALKSINKEERIHILTQELPLSEVKNSFDNAISAVIPAEENFFDLSDKLIKAAIERTNKIEEKIVEEIIKTPPIKNAPVYKTGFEFEGNEDILATYLELDDEAIRLISEKKLEKYKGKVIDTEFGGTFALEEQEKLTRETLKNISESFDKNEFAAIAKVLKEINTRGGVLDKVAVYDQLYSILKSNQRTYRVGKKIKKADDENYVARPNTGSWGVPEFFRAEINKFGEITKSYVRNKALDTEYIKHGLGKRAIKEGIEKTEKIIEAGKRIEKILDSLKNMSLSDRNKIKYDVQKKEVSKIIADTQEVIMRDDIYQEGVSHNIWDNVIQQARKEALIDKEIAFAKATNPNIPPDELTTPKAIALKKELDELRKEKNFILTEQLNQTIVKTIKYATESPERQVNARKIIESLETEYSDLFESLDVSGSPMQKIVGIAEEKILKAKTAEEIHAIRKSLIERLELEKITQDAMNFAEGRSGATFSYDQEQINNIFSKTTQSLIEEYAPMKALGFLGAFDPRNFQTLLTHPLTARFMRNFISTNKAVESVSKRNMIKANALLKDYSIVGDKTIMSMYSDGADRLTFLKEEDEVILREMYELESYGISVSRFEKPATDYQKQKLIVNEIVDEIELRDKSGKTIKASEAPEHIKTALSDYFNYIFSVSRKVKDNVDNVFSARQTMDKNLNEWDDAIASMRIGIREHILNTQVRIPQRTISGLKKIGANEPVGVNALSIMFGENTAEAMKKAIIADYSTKNIFKSGAFFMGKYIAGAFSKYFSIPMVIQDVQRLTNELQVIQKNISYSRGSSLADEYSATEEIFKYLGKEKSVPPVGFGNLHFGITTPEQALGEKAFYSDGVFTRGAKKIDDILQKVSNIGDHLTPTNRFAEYIGGEIHKTIFVDYVTKTEYRSVKKLMECIKYGDEKAIRIGKEVVEMADERARIATGNFIGVDAKNPLMQSRYGALWYFNFFNKWGAGMMGHATTKLLDPWTRAIRVAAKGDMKKAMSIMIDAFDDAEGKALISGMLNIYKYQQMAAIAVDDEAFNAEWTGVGQTSAALGVLLYPPTKAAVQAVNAYNAYDEIPPEIQSVFGENARLSVTISEGVSAFLSSLLSQYNSLTSATVEGFNTYAKFDDATMYDIFVEGFLKTFFSAVTRDRDSKYVRGVKTDMISSKLANDATGFISSMYMTPEINDYNRSINIIQSLLYNIDKAGDKNNAFTLFLNSLLRKSDIFNFKTLETRTPQELYSRINEAMNNPEIQMIINDPAQAILEGHISPKFVYDKIKSVDFDTKDYAFLNAANQFFLANDKSFTTKLGTTYKTNPAVEKIRDGRETFKKRMSQALIEKDITQLQTLMDDDIYKEFVGEIGGGTLAMRYFFDMAVDNAQKNKAEDTTGLAQKSMLTEEEQNNIVESLMLINVEYLFGDNELPSKGEKGMSSIEAIFNTDKPLLADVVADKVARSVGWDYSKNKKGEDKEKSADSISSNTAYKVAHSLAMREIIAEEKGIVEAQRYLTDTNTLMKNITVPDNPESNRKFAAIVNEVSDIINGSNAPIEAKKDLQRGMVAANIDKFDKIIQYAEGQAWIAKERDAIVDVAKFMYDVGEYDISERSSGSGSGNNPKTKKLATKAKKILDGVAAIDPSIKLKSYNPESYETLRNKIAGNGRSAVSRNTFSGGRINAGDLRIIPASSKSSKAPTVAKGEISVSEGKIRISKIPVGAKTRISTERLERI